MNGQILNLYLLRCFLFWLAITSIGLLAIAFLGDFLEMIKFTNRINQGSLDALYYTSLRLPLIFLDFLPFIFLFSTVSCLLRLSETNELVVIRAAGISVWRFLMPFVLSALIIGLVMIAVLEPLGIRGRTSFQQIENRLSGARPEFSISENGIWLRETLPTGSLILRAGKIANDTAIDKINNTGRRLQDVSVLVFDDIGKFTQRIKAETAHLDGNFWRLQKVQLITAGKQIETPETISFQTQLKIDALDQHFKSPRSINIWQLANYINRAGASGVDVTRHQVRWHSLVSLPFMLIAMVLVAACFSLPTGRIMSGGRTIGLVILSGFGIYMANDFVARLGDINVLSPALASWSSSGIATFLSVSYLLSIEDG